MKYLNFKRIFAPAGRGSVLIIATLLLSSAAIRLLTGASGAFAQDSQLPTAQMSAAKTSAAETETNDKSKDEQRTKTAFRTSNSEISGLIKAIQEREIQVAKREKQLEIRLRALTVADDEIEKRIIKLTETEETLRTTLSLADKASEKDIERLVSVYENMKSKDAAALFEQMEPSFSAGFLGSMRPDIAAEILAGLSPQIAYSISVILAGRNAAVPKS